VCFAEPGDPIRHARFRRKPKDQIA
jgi:hypothetical protein